MRIVAGRYGGQKLVTPHGKDIRPASDKIRGAVFNMLCSRMSLEEVQALDGFCGTGALGLEALSRGAKHCTFFDVSYSSLKLAQENAENLSALENCTFTRQNTLNLKNRPANTAPFDLIFLDPPYYKNMVSQCLEALAVGHWIAQNAFIVCETEKKADITLPNGLSLETEKTYGQIKITLLKY